MNSAGDTADRTHHALQQIKVTKVSSHLMAPFLYRCPNTGRQVQGWIADDPTDEDDDTYQSLECLACTRVHLVNPKTGRVAGFDDD